MSEQGRAFAAVLRVAPQFCRAVFRLVQWPSCRARAFDMTPHQFVGIQIRRVAGQEVQGQPAFGRWRRSRARCAFLCAGRLSSTRCTGFLRYFIICCSSSMNSSRVERTVVGAEPKRALGIDRRSGAEGLPLPGTLHHRRLAAHAPSLAMDRVGPESGLIPEEDLGALGLGLFGNGRIGFALPPLDRFRIALVGALQRLLRRQPEFRQQFADRRQPERHVELLRRSIRPPLHASTTRSPNRTGADHGH